MTTANETVADAINRIDGNAIARFTFREHMGHV
jgi:hypothetical protein